ncbi:DUF4157 domain-containing protein [Halobaculum sp. MBLA0147]|uniref:eCIS core domain-containing protein n=1 Tax=Halobaculum sp. MBLA0147 TaxID=3079934 RepID=UPI0035246A44
MGREYASRENRNSERSDDEGQRTEFDDSWEWWSGEGDSVQRQSAGPGTNPSWEEAEAYYQREIEDTDEYKTLQRMEKRYGRLFDQWVEEGVPTDAMGDRESIQAYRRHKGTPIPWYIDDFNDNSLWRNTTDIFEDDREGRDGQTDVPDSVRDVMTSPGRSLDTSIQRAVEERMDESFGDVRIHTDAKAAAAADEIDARAFTVGNHVAFGAGEYDPASAEGQHVLVHELAHVRQQTDGVVSMLPRSAAVPTEDDGEPRQSPTVPGYVTREWTSGSTDVDGVHLQRFPAWDDRMTDPAVADDPLATFAEERNVPESLVARIETLVDDDRYEEFLTDIYRIAESQKDVGDSKGDVGEVLSAHPDSGILSDLVPELRERDELVAVPKNDNTVKGFQINAPGNPEFDKVVLNIESMDVVAVIEEKIGGSDDSTSETAIEQAQTNADKIVNGQLLDGDVSEKVDRSNRLTVSIDELNSGDFGDVEVGTVVPADRAAADHTQDINDDRVATYPWSTQQLKLMYKIVREAAPWG